MTDVSVFHIFVMVVLSGILILMAILLVTAIEIWNVVKNLPEKLELLRSYLSYVNKCLVDQGVTVQEGKRSLDTLEDNSSVTGARIDEIRNVVLELYGLATKIPQFKKTDVKNKR